MAVQQHGAGTANTMLAASMRSRESKLIAQAIRQRRTRLNNSVAFFAVYLEYDRMQLVFICTTHYKPSRPFPSRSIALSTNLRNKHSATPFRYPPRYPGHYT